MMPPVELMMPYSRAAFQSRASTAPCKTGSPKAASPSLLSEFCLVYFSGVFSADAAEPAVGSAVPAFAAGFTCLK